MEQDKERLPRKDQSSYPDNIRRKKKKGGQGKKLLILNVRLTGIQTDRMTTRQITNRYMRDKQVGLAPTVIIQKDIQMITYACKKTEKMQMVRRKNVQSLRTRKKKTNTQTNSHTGRQRDKRAHDRTDTKTDRRTREHRKLNR